MDFFVERKLKRPRVRSGILTQVLWNDQKHRETKRTCEPDQMWTSRRRVGQVPERCKEIKLFPIHDAKTATPNQAGRGALLEKTAEFFRDGKSENI
jgi:hypothetical protein